MSEPETVSAEAFVFPFQENLPPRSAWPAGAEAGYRLRTPVTEGKNTIEVIYLWDLNGDDLSKTDGLIEATEAQKLIELSGRLLPSTVGGMKAFDIRRLLRIVRVFLDGSPVTGK